MARGSAWLGTALVVAGALVLSISSGSAEDVDIVVTNAGDSVDPGESVCPDESLCTLRRAIEHANETSGDDPVVIRFAQDVFPPAEPTTIGLIAGPLPAITRHNISIDATNAGVVLSGAELETGSPGNGLEIAGANVTLRGLAVRRFEGSCIQVTGANATIGGSATAGQGNAINDCGVAITVNAAGAVIEGNTIGAGIVTRLFAVGIDVAGGDARIGHETLTARQNHIGNAVVGIRVGDPTKPAATANIRNNVLGRTPAGTIAPVLTGVRIVPPASDVRVIGNQFANLLRGIVIVDRAGAEPSMGNTLRHNRFQNLHSIAIDFGPTGASVPNDPGDADEGPNGLQNHPVFTRAAQAEIRGEVPGPCASCVVDIYVAERRGGPGLDVPLQPLTGATATTNAAGEFVLTSLPVSPGDWLMAIATDPDGNTSEFSQAIRVGSGIVQCGFETMYPGWNSMGYFGPAVSLGSVFPPGAPPPGAVRSIHRLVSGPLGNYQSWFASDLFSSTLTTVSTGAAYWFRADVESQLPGSFTLQEPLPVSLSEGWNQFVYIGAEEAVENALASIGGQFEALYRYVNDGESQRWLTYGTPDAPAWVRSLDTMEPCAVYHILMTGDATLTPPQP